MNNPQRSFPKQGDIIWLDFDPQSGSEISKRRPALVVSNNDLQNHSNFATVIPITSSNNAFPLHIALDHRTHTSGFIICEQLRNVDFKARNWQLIEQAPEDVLDDVLEIISAMYAKS